ncbi:Hypothetical predicted protein [Mytilus galloprovincialis]|uniref:Uncharacterized protein n=1 Tax=Mytilus galloprovincialis TaxID=29158 RepID=A0A8B6DL34_MYTGA|nr:Hypothetical predicted protein [Mytilus galloprovincialis]
MGKLGMKWLCMRDMPKLYRELMIYKKSSYFIADPQLGSCQRCRQEDVRLSDPDSTVKVHADKPHLVSLGSGRLSTAVTIIPLHNGRTDIGTVDAEVLPDLIIQGTGVEDDHCYIDNIHGVVTFTPLAKLCFIDQHLVCEPTRLTQGRIFTRYFDSHITGKRSV